MVSYSYDEVVNTLKAAGFSEVKNNGGSHQMFVNKKIGISQPVPKHGKSLKSGTAESILKFAVFAAYISNINIANDRHKLSDKVIDFIKKCHISMKENKMNIIPESTRNSMGIETNERAELFITALKEKLKSSANKEDEKGL